MTKISADVLEIKPINAWLLVGDRASFPATRPALAQRLRDRFRGDDEDDIWTGPAQAQRGDLVLFYFMAPDKEIRFAARVTSDPFSRGDIHVASERNVGQHQHWIRHSPMVPVPPITFDELRDIVGGQLVLKGKPRHYLRPEEVTRLRELMASRSEGGSLTGPLDRVMTVPVGDPDLPDPLTVTFDQWRQMADGALVRSGSPRRLEKEIERYVVEPLLRLALSRHPDVAHRRQFPVPGGGVVDYVVLVQDRPTAVIEAKAGIALPRDGRWDESREFAQTRRYMDRLGIPGMLIDSRTAYLIESGSGTPVRTVRRATTTGEDLTAIARHLTTPPQP